MLYWLPVCICLRLLVWNAGRSHVKNTICKRVGGGGGGKRPPCPSPSAAYDFSYNTFYCSVTFLLLLGKYFVELHQLRINAWNSWNSFATFDKRKPWKTVKLLIWDIGYVHTWFPSTVPEYDYRWALMWTHLFFKYPRQNSGTVLVSDTRALKWSWYLGNFVSEHNTIWCRCPGTSARAPSVNMAIVCIWVAIYLAYKAVVFLPSQQEPRKSNSIVICMFHYFVKFGSCGKNRIHSSRFFGAVRSVQLYIS